MSIRDWIRKSRKWLMIGLFIVLSYVGIYTALSAAGEYRPSHSGKLRYWFGLAVTDRALWQPKGMYLAQRVDVSGQSKTDGNLLGYFFCPLILLDRAYCHPTIYYFEEASP